MNFSLIVIISLLTLTWNSNANVLNSDVTFHLFTKEKLESPIQIGRDYPNISRTDTIVILIHGWREDIYGTGYVELKNAFLLQTNKSNSVVLVDWSRPASQFYPFAVGAIFPVGEIVADFITNLVLSHGLPLKNLHVCGHSLGAHVIGVAAKKLQIRSLKLPRITALDPAGILFEGFIFSDNYRLNRRDGEVVVVVHTDGGKFGYLSSCGTVDFFPNGGRFLQPGCPDNAGGGAWFWCSHQRSFVFFADSLRNSGTFVGTKCFNYEAFIARSCDGSKELDLGGDITVNDEGDYYLTTNPKKPYGQGSRQCVKENA